MRQPLRIWTGAPGDGTSALAAVLAREPGLSVASARDPKDFERGLSAADLDLALLETAQAPSEDLLASLARARGARALPLLVIAPHEDVAAAGVHARAWTAGLTDVAPEGAGAAEIAWRIGRLVDLQRTLSGLEQRASLDERTGLLRATEFERRVREHVSAAERHAHELALLVFDLDRFGEINKKHLHTTGDLVVEHVGAVVRGALRLEDVAGRLGGDEFGVLLPYTTRIDAARVVARLLQHLRALRVTSLRDGSLVEVRASLGFDTLAPGDLHDPALLRAHAETALRAAKEAGGDRAVYFRSLGT